MHAVIFDIDGTLLDSYGINNSMYADAVRATLGPVFIRDAREKYTRVTDTGVLADICSDNALRYDDSVSTAVMQVYLGFLRSHMEIQWALPGDSRSAPLARADDYQDRAQIMLHALGQLEGPFDSIAYFGDGLWDRAAAAQLGWKFVAVGSKLGGLLDFGAVPISRAYERSRD